MRFYDVWFKHLNWYQKYIVEKPTKYAKKKGPWILPIFYKLNLFKCVLKTDLKSWVNSKNSRLSACYKNI